MVTGDRVGSFELGSSSVEFEFFEIERYCCRSRVDVDRHGCPVLRSFFPEATMLRRF